MLTKSLYIVVFVYVTATLPSTRSTTTRTWRRSEEDDNGRAPGRSDTERLAKTLQQLHGQRTSEPRQALALRLRWTLPALPGYQRPCREDPEEIGSIFVNRVENPLNLFCSLTEVCRK